MINKILILLWTFVFSLVGIQAKSTASPVNDSVRADADSVFIPIDRQQAAELVSKMVAGLYEKEFRAARADSLLMVAKLDMLKHKMLDDALRKYYVREYDQRLERLERLMMMSLMQQKAKEGNISPEEYRQMLSMLLPTKKGNRTYVLSPGMQQPSTQYIEQPETGYSMSPLTGQETLNEPVSRQNKPMMSSLQPSLPLVSPRVSKTHTGVVLPVPLKQQVDTVANRQSANTLLKGIEQPSERSLVLLPNAVTRIVDTIYVEKETPTAPPRVKPFTKSLYFAFNSADLSAEGKATMDGLVALMQEYPNVQCALRGYSSPVGNMKYNNRLSQRRVNACVAYLLQQGVSALRLNAQARGIDSMVSNADARRVDLIVR